MLQKLFVSDVNMKPYVRSRWKSEKNSIKIKSNEKHHLKSSDLDSLKLDVSRFILSNTQIHLLHKRTKPETLQIYLGKAILLETWNLILALNHILKPSHVAKLRPDGFFIC